MHTHRRARALFAVFGLALFAGCGGPATFVSADPPPSTSADAWYAAGIPAVRVALARAMESEGLTVSTGTGATIIVGRKHVVPYIDDETSAPAAGPLPLYVLEATLGRAAETHVRATLNVRHGADHDVPFEWEYPTDLIRRVFERARDNLHEPRAKLRVPPRYRAPRWRRPRHPIS